MVIPELTGAMNHNFLLNKLTDICDIFSYPLFPISPYRVSHGLLDAADGVEYLSGCVLASKGAYQIT